VAKSQAYIEEWRVVADRFSVINQNELSDLAPDGVKCKACWDTDICAECLGEYPHQCPNECGDGTCPECRLEDEQLAYPVGTEG